MILENIEKTLEVPSARGFLAPEVGSLLRVCLVLFGP